ncbi:amino acid adenylation domain-containing protein [Micromonospora sp. WMMA1949]|uniref:non-ribosomal peptide synthetase n=1 Tax=unclassified Micromonospora TaxID=2617518 RepID=UPI0022B6F6E1|nr:amino acid adenylation domain-containing protein [Micromonospora sp. WMMA1949]MCZ7428597.1 amino acid adenylation domain-containing protein [Micromonospora sp. WMMA1949]
MNETPGWSYATPSFSQQRVFAEENLQDIGPAYTLASGLRLRGDLDVGALRAALVEVTARHEMLRSAIRLVDGRAALVIHDGLPPVLEHHDLRELPPGERERAAWQRLRDAQEFIFDLGRAPLWRVLLLTVADDESWLFLTLHHVIIDGWSMGVLWRDLTIAYEAALAGVPGPFEPLPITFSGYTAELSDTLRDGRLDDLLRHWRDRLADGGRDLELPLDRPRPPVRGYDGAGYAFTLPPGLAHETRRLATRHRTTMFVTLLAVFARLLAHMAGTEDVVVGVPLANRDRPDTVDLIGLLVNPLPIRLPMASCDTVADLMALVRRATLDAMAHQAVPFDRLVRDLAPRREPGRHPLFSVVFSVQAIPEHGVEFPTLRAEVLPTPIGPSTTLDLNVLFHDTGEQLSGYLEYRTDLFDRATVERLAERFQNLLAGAVVDGARLADLDVCGPGERRRLVTELAVTGPAEPPAGLHTLIESVADRRPDAPALVTATAVMTYAELDARANAVAHALVARGVGPDRLVAVGLPRGPELVVTLLGVLKAGGAYLALDPAEPTERRRWMLADARPALVVTDGTALPVDGPTDRPRVRVDPANLAYVAYTSGSTGRPKGVSITHAGLVNFTSARSPMTPVPEDVMAVHSSAGFDAFGYEVWSTLCAGGRLLLAPPKERLDPDDYRWLAHHSTAMFMTPGLLATLLRVDPAIAAGPRLLGLGGDRVDPDLVARARARAASPDRVTLNCYGPTECTIAAVAGPASRRTAFDRVPIGRPLPGMRGYLLDVRLRPVPLGVTGELYLGGPGLARGYLGAPALTAERFVADPFVRGERMYRTGDLARWLDDGALEFLGRHDDQLKIRGIRVEPGETEAALREHPLVRSAVVVPRSGAGGLRLVGYVVPEAGTALDPVTTAALLDHVRYRLPAPLVPAVLVGLPELPLTANGKVDRAALPTVPDAPPAPSPEPLTADQELVAAVWREALDRPDIGLDDDFFDLGGDSLTALRVVAELDARGAGVPLAELYRRGTVRAVAAYLAEGDAPPG